MASFWTALFSILLLLLSSVAQAQTTAKYCNADNLCYLQFSTRTTNPVFRIAVPDASAAPFDTLLQITAPAGTGWAGFAWGGGMTLNPLTVAWPNGNKVTVSSRWATGRDMPTMYSSATYTTLSSSANSTHWQIEVLCSGCSRWGSKSLSPTSLNTFAWAMSKRAVSQPASASSSFTEHNTVGMFNSDLTMGRNTQAAFKAYVSKAGKS